MRIKYKVETSLVRKEVALFDDEEMELAADVRVSFTIPEQTQHLPHEIEALINKAGQQFKRLMYKLAMEWADEDLIMDMESEKQIQRRGKKSYTFKTMFGTVKVERSRVKDKKGRTIIPAMSWWGTPRQVCITKGLKAAICDFVSKESISDTVTEIEKWAGEEGLISRKSVENILQREGAALIKAQEERAASVYEKIPEAKILIIENRKSRQSTYQKYLSYDFGMLEDEQALGQYRVIWSWDQGEEIKREVPQRTIEEGLIVVQLDEVRAPAQAQTGKREFWIYTGVVNAGIKRYYFSSGSATKLFYQVGALLAVLGVHKGERGVYILGDGAHWIRSWYRNLPITRKSMALCWFHLTRVCQELLSSSFGKFLGAKLASKVLSRLWKGDVATALARIAANQERVINKVNFRKLMRYLRARWPWIVNYEQQKAMGCWIANTQVEKYNDWAVAARCKGQGRTWGADSVNSIAAIEAARRNGELEYWRYCGRLPEWK
ncbi:MAG: hypothetical protein AB1489_37880 [Acidobacteriota bacterium]